MREERKEVLVVGAGPVGLWTALELARAGVEVKIIDHESRTAARSYACALHPRTMEALDRAGLAERLLGIGRKVSKIAFYEGATRQAEIDLGKDDGKFPFLLIVPQNELESVLEEELATKCVKVQWMHRLDSFALERESLSVLVEELQGTCTGYVVPHWETTVRKQIPVRAQFIVGADGHHSLTRRRMQVEYKHLSGPDIYAAYEFVMDAPSEAAAEVRIVLEPESTNVLWPLPGDKARWTFQIVQSEQVEFPEKERRAIRLMDSTVDDRVRDYVQRVAQKRAPWFKASVKEVTWCTKVSFEQRLVESFGHGRCWLIGDAAHQTGPVGVQSMNSGFAEGEMLAGYLAKIVRGAAEVDALEEYSKRQMQVWEQLVGPAGLKSNGSAKPWVAQNSKRMLSCMPGIGEDLNKLAAQIGLQR